jgi:hypothetical protein
MGHFEMHEGASEDTALNTRGERKPVARRKKQKKIAQYLLKV